MKTTILALAAASAAALFATSAHADEATATATVTTPTVKHVDDPGASDHDKFIGHFAVGYFGVSQIPIAGPTSTGTSVSASTVTAPVIGVRYWKDDFLGFDLGLGIGVGSGSATAVSGGTTTTTDSPSQFGLGIHGGLPMSLVSGKHFDFEIIPEVNVAFASGTIKAPAGSMASDISLSGLRVDLGARVGAEIHFGFIGIPELSLQGSVGLFFDHSSLKSSQDNNSASLSGTSFATSVQSDPWALFVNNISAFYYF